MKCFFFGGLLVVLSHDVTRLATAFSPIITGTRRRTTTATLQAGEPEFLESLAASVSMFIAPVSAFAAGVFSLSNKEKLALDVEEQEVKLEEIKQKLDSSKIQTTTAFGVAAASAAFAGLNIGAPDLVKPTARTDPAQRTNLPASEMLKQDEYQAMEDKLVEETTEPPTVSQDPYQALEDKLLGETKPPVEAGPAVIPPAPVESEYAGPAVIPRAPSEKIEDAGPAVIPRISQETVEEMEENRVPDAVFKMGAATASAIEKVENAAIVAIEEARQAAASAVDYNPGAVEKMEEAAFAAASKIEDAADKVVEEAKVAGGRVMEKAELAGPAVIGRLQDTTSMEMLEEEAVGEMEEITSSVVEKLEGVAIAAINESKEANAAAIKETIAGPAVIPRLEVAKVASAGAVATVEEAATSAIQDTRAMAATVLEEAKVASPDAAEELDQAGQAGKQAVSAIEETQDTASAAVEKAELAGPAVVGKVEGGETSQLIEDAKVASTPATESLGAPEKVAEPQGVFDKLMEKLEAAMPEKASIELKPEEKVDVAPALPTQEPQSYLDSLSTPEVKLETPEVKPQTPEPKEESPPVISSPIQEPKVEVPAEVMPPLATGTPEANVPVTPEPEIESPPVVQAPPVTEPAQTKPIGKVDEAFGVALPSVYDNIKLPSLENIQLDPAIVAGTAGATLIAASLAGSSKDGDRSSSPSPSSASPKSTGSQLSYQKDLKSKQSTAPPRSSPASTTGGSARSPPGSTTTGSSPSGSYLDTMAPQASAPKKGYGFANKKYAQVSDNASYKAASAPVSAMPDVIKQQLAPKTATAPPMEKTPDPPVATGPGASYLDSMSPNGQTAQPAAFSKKETTAPPPAAAGPGASYLDSINPNGSGGPVTPNKPAVKAPYNPKTSSVSTPPKQQAAGTGSYLDNL